MKKWTYLIVFFSLSQIIFASIPLRKAIAAGIRLNLTLQNQLLAEKIQQLNQSNTQKKKWFSLDLAGSYLYRSAQMEIILPDMNPAPGITVPGERIQAGARHNYDLKIALMQPIFLGNMIGHSHEIEKIKGALENKKTNLKKIEVTTAIKASYFQYHLLASRQKSLQTMLEQLNLHHKKIHHYFQEELLKKSDLLETQSKIEEINLSLEDLKHLIVKEQIHFKHLCGLEINDIETGFKEKTADFTEAFAQFHSSHPFLKSFSDQSAILAIRKKVTAGEYLPHISGFAELHYGKPGIDFFKNEWSVYFQSGINVDLKLFRRDKKKRDLTIIDYLLEKVSNQKKDFVNTSKKRLKQLFSMRKSTETKINILKNLIQISAEDNKLKENLVDEHQISNIDYLASLSNNQAYRQQMNELEAGLQLIKVNINHIIGFYQEEK